MKLRLAAAGAVLALSTWAAADAVKAPPEAADKIAAKLKAPAGFDLSVFASPPDVSYPTAVSASPNGEVFVAIDEQGSLGKTPGGGRVVRVVDTKGTGHADQITTFARMEHPRGVIWDASAHALYVLHPPFLTVYYDDNGDGVADRSENLATGITTEATLNSRGADHTTNNIRLGIDGWIYIAMGDFGAVHAVGKDGTVLQKHGGGVVRIRPDGSGLESYSSGQRNIFDVAIDPLMNVFTRDNTNDGDAWNDRLSYIVPTGIYGYPSLFRHFPGEFIDCLNDYGDGSPCGSLFVDEPNMPAGFTHTLLTVEWGAGGGALYRHPLTASGAGYAAPTPEELVMKLPRGTDVDIDGQQHLYLSSWVGATFTYAGPNVGYLLQLSPHGATPAAFPKLADANVDALVGFLSSPSGVLRQAAQRELVQRGDKPAVAESLEKLAKSEAPIEARAAAIFTLKLLQHDAADKTLIELSSDESIREIALRVLCDRKENKAIPIAPFVKALDDANPRIRLIGAWGLGRLGHVEAANALVPHLADEDFLVSHVTINSLVLLNAIEPCLKALDPQTPRLASGAAQVLQRIHEPGVVDGLAGKLSQIHDPATRTIIYRVLARLYYREADWDGSWWNTRPDTSGPYYKTAEWSQTSRIGELLKNAIATEPAEIANGFVLDIVKDKLDIPEAAMKLKTLAQSDPKISAALVELMSDRPNINADQIALLTGTASNEKFPAALRAKAITTLSRGASKRSVIDAIVSILEPIAVDEHAAPELAGAYDAFVREPRLVQNISYFIDLSQNQSQGRERIGFGVVLNAANSRLGARGGPGRENARNAITKAWDVPAQQPALLYAIGRAKSRGYDERILALVKDKDATVAAAARYAAERVGAKPASMANAENTIDKIGYEKTVALVAKDKDKGDEALGKDLFTRQGCVACHTTSAGEAPKGPFLGGIGSKYNRAELCESIMKPSAKIAQGFETQYFRVKSGDITEGFVTRESADEVEVRNATGVPITIKKADIDRRGRRDTSIMPEGLVAPLSPHDLASILAYLESLPGK